MLEKEMPMPIGEYVRLIKQRALEMSKKGMALAHKFYWDMVMERLVLYRRSSECEHGLLLAEKHKPIEYTYNSKNEKEYFYMELPKRGKSAPLVASLPTE